MKPFAAIAFVLVLLGAGCTDIPTPPPYELTFYNDAELDIDTDAYLSVHHTYLHTSTDGVIWSDGELIVNHASVPDIIEVTHETQYFSPGDLLVYFVDGTKEHGRDGDNQLGLVVSHDGGDSWTGRTFVTIEGAPRGAVVADPSLVELEDGTLRLYFYDFSSGSKRNQDKTFYSAISQNGINFTVEQSVYAREDLITDPDVVQFNDQWYLFFAQQEPPAVQFLTSDTPYDFTDVQTIDGFTGIPSAQVIDDRLYVYGCGNGGISGAYTTDGVTFTVLEQSLARSQENPLICDPSVHQLQNGTYIMVTKQISEEGLATQKTGGATDVGGTIYQPTPPTPPVPPTPPRN